MNLIDAVAESETEFTWVLEQAGLFDGDKIASGWDKDRLYFFHNDVRQTSAVSSIIGLYFNWQSMEMTEKDRGDENPASFKASVALYVRSQYPSNDVRVTSALRAIEEKARDNGWNMIATGIEGWDEDNNVYTYHYLFEKIFGE